MTLTVGSLCAGYEGISQGLALAGWPIELTWVAENDPAASRLLAHHHPGVPNRGDITATNWADVPQVDIVTAGFPCQDLSCAGRRAGMGTGTRSGVWANVVEAVAVLRPAVIVVENVEAILWTEAKRSSDAAGNSDLEPGPAGLGNRADGSVLRALGAVLGDLSTIGFDAEWTTVSAASVGAPHLRKRVFVLAWPADSSGQRHRDTWQAIREGMEAAAERGAVRPAGHTGVGGLLPTPAARLADKRGMPSVETAAARMYEEGRRNLEDAVALLPTPAARDWRSGESNIMDRNARPLNEVVVNLLPTPTARDGMSGPGHATTAEGSPDLRTTVTLFPTPRATDGTNGGPNQRGSSGDLMLPSAVMELLPTPTATPYGNNQSPSPNAAVRPSLNSLATGALLPTPTVADSRGSRNASDDASDDASGDWSPGWSLSDVAYADRWGRYASAIARWEQVLGRRAPDPTEPGTRGQPRLAPRFVEWLQGLPDGWVTAVPDLKRNEMLRILGNGVVPQQCAVAITHLARIRLADLDTAADLPAHPEPRR